MPFIAGNCLNIEGINTVLIGADGLACNVQIIYNDGGAFSEITRLYPFTLWLSNNIIQTIIKLKLILKLLIQC